MKKVAEKPKKINYSVKMTGVVPVTFFYKVEAESPEEALKKVMAKQAIVYNPTMVNWASFKPIEAKVLEFGMAIIKLIKRLS